MAALTIMYTIWLRIVPLVFDADRFEDLEPAEQAIVIVVGSLFVLAMLGIHVTILYLLYKNLQAVPADFRRMEPSMVWLLLIPCFNLIWNFFVFSRIAGSYQDCLHERGRRDFGDCGAGIGIAYSICAVLVSIPCLNYLTVWFCGPAMIVLIILYLVKLHGLKQEIASGTDAAVLNDDPQPDPI
jgi:hypothetical protein